MSDVLAVLGGADADAELVEELARRHPDRVIVLAEDECAGRGRRRTRGRRAAAAQRARVTAVVRLIEDRTGAIVVGTAANRAQLRGWRFDREVRGRRPGVA